MESDPELQKASLRIFLKTAPFFLLLAVLLPNAFVWLGFGQLRYFALYLATWISVVIVSPLFMIFDKYAWPSELWKSYLPFAIFSFLVIVAFGVL